MAILEKIRKRSVFLIIVIGLALFSFVISGVIKTDNSGNTPSAIGEVNGESISRDAFLVEVENVSKRYGASLSTLQAMDQVWNQEIRKKLLEEQFKELGIRIEKDQIINVIKSIPAFAQDSIFQNEAGLFDEAKFIEFIADLKANNPASYAQWELQEQALINASKEQTYFNLVKAGINVTLKEGELNYTSENDKLAIKYVQLPYSAIPDSTITISKAEIKKYINNHKKDFKAEPLTSIQYVYFEEKPSLQDEKEIETRIVGLLKNSVEYNPITKTNDTIAGFATTANIEDFINKNSDMPFDSTFVAKKELPSPFADSLFNLKTGEVYGPYKDGGYFKISRMMAKRTEGSVKASHILISYKGAARANPIITRTKEEAEIKAKEVLNNVQKNPENFAQFAKDNSDDPTTALRGGDLGYFQKGAMVKPFNDFAFGNAVGKIDLVETDFGFHIIKIDDKEAIVQIATIAQKIDPSEETINTIFKDATQFEIEVTQKEFIEAAKEHNYSVRPVKNLTALDENIAGIGDQRSLVQWTFHKDTKVGDIKRFNIGGGYVIVQLTEKIKKGTVSNEDITIKVKPILIKQKKAALITEKNKGKSLQELVEKNKLPLRTASELTMKKLIIPGVGREPKIIGAAFALKEGETSGFVEGENGVYKVEVTKKEVAKPLDNYITYANTQKTTSRNKVNTSAYNALKEAAKIKDNRAKFY